MLRALYPDAVKPKSHHILHLPEQVAAIGYAATCFTGERKHHWLKLLAEHKFRGFERAVATEMLAICAEDWRSRGARPPPQLISPTDSAEGAEIWAEVFGPCACQASAAADLCSGGARRGDLLRLAGGEVGWAVGFWQIHHAGGLSQFACVELLQATGPNSFAAAAGVEALRPLADAPLLAPLAQGARRKPRRKRSAAWAETRTLRPIASITRIFRPIAPSRLAAEVRAAVSHFRRPNADARELPELL